MPERGPAVGIDATPAAWEHRGRGIGRHVGAILTAADETAPDWAATALGTLLLPGQAATLAGTTWRTHRSAVRPQDLDPFVAVLADRLAIRRRPPRFWHHTDPLIPVSPLGASRTIVTVYDLIPLSEPDVWASIRPHRRRFYRRYLELARNSRGIISISAATASEVSSRLGVPAEQIRIVPPHVGWIGRDGGGGGPVEPGGSPGWAMPASDGGHRRFLFVGVLEPHKRPELAIGTIAELVRRGEAATLSIVGARPASRRAVLEGLAGGLGVADRVTFVDRPDDAALAALFRTSTLLATSRIEGFGLPPVEAILAGGRVAAVPTEVYREVLTDAATFSVDDSPGALADAAITADDTVPVAAARTALEARFGAAAATEALQAAYVAFGAS